MAIDFPGPPLTVGQKHPTTPVEGVPTYTYDGEKWITGTSVAGSTFVLKVGDTMTGNLNIQKADSQLVLNTTAATGAAIRAQTGGSDRWVMQLGNGIAEGGVADGSNFALLSYNNAGVFQGAVMTAIRATSQVDFAGAVYVNGNLNGSAQGNFAGNIYGSLNVRGGTLITSSVVQSEAVNLVLGSGSAAGGVYLRPRGPSDGEAQAYVESSGGYFVANGHNLVGGRNGGWQCKTGDSNTLTGGYYNISWQSPNMHLYLDNTYFGVLFTLSDYRIKKDVQLLPDMWDSVKALRPVKYTNCDYTPESAREQSAKSGEPFVKANDTEQWGFIAHELQETLLPTAASGEKDMTNGLQAPNVWPVIAALTKTIQEMQARIEALEAG